MSSFSFEIKGTQRLNIKLKKLQKKIQNPVPLWTRLEPKIKAQIRRQFDSGGKELGASWKKLANKTVIQKIRLGLNNGTLKRTKRLYGSFVTKKKNRIELVIGAKGKEEDKLRYHQLGTKKIPKREVLKVSSPAFRSLLRREIILYLKTL
jgi:phage gpG-like protein